MFSYRRDEFVPPLENDRFYTISLLVEEARERVSQDLGEDAASRIECKRTWYGIAVHLDGEFLFDLEV